MVCTYNGSRTIAETLSHLQDLDYPDYEVIVINDGSRDSTGTIAEEYGARVVTVANTFWTGPPSYSAAVSRLTRPGSEHALAQWL